MSKREFAQLIAAARDKTGLSLRQLADRTGIEYSRLSRIEHGTRPAPDLGSIRQLAEVLEIDLIELLISAGTSREVVEEILWSERLNLSDASTSVASYRPDDSPLQAKNVFCVPVVERKRAVCTVLLGTARLSVLWFSAADRVRIEIPPQSVLVFPVHPAKVLGSSENVLIARLRKLRRLGQVVNIVLEGDGYELNALQSETHVRSAGLRESTEVFLYIPASSIRTGPGAHQEDTP